jgi:hypothetical protein
MSFERIRIDAGQSLAGRYFRFFLTSAERATAMMPDDNSRSDRRCVGAAHRLRAQSKRWTLALAAAFAITSAYAADTHVQIYPVKSSFENVKEEVSDAIIKRGLVIDYTAHIGAMLSRTGKDVGATKTVYSDAQSVQFCSATLSRRTMEADPTNIAFCPYVIFMYALPDSPGVTYVGYRPLSSVGSQQSKAAIEAVNKLLDGIVREAAGKK